VLDNQSVELGTQDKEVVLQVAWKRTTRAFSTVPRGFDIKPQVTSWRKFTLTTTLCSWSPDELACLLSVITRQCWDGPNRSNKKIGSWARLGWQYLSSYKLPNTPLVWCIGPKPR
jgi:hypothetical protein